MSKSSTATKTKRARKVAPIAWAPPTETRALMLRTCDADMKAHGGFIWPRSGYVEAPDWKQTTQCGNGLHGLLWGAGNASLLNADADDWLVVEIDAAEAIDLGGKVKVPRGNVVFVGSRVDAVTMIQSQAPAGTPVVYATVSGGDRSTVSGGDRSTVSGGDYSTVSGGDYSTVSGGDRSTVSGGDRSTVSGGDRSIVSGRHGSTVSGGHGSIVSGRHGSTVSGGHGSIVSGRHGSTVSGGDYSTVSGRDGSTVSGGDYSTVSGGHGSTVSGGLYSCIAIEWFDGRRYRKAIAEVDGETIKAGVKYRIDAGKFVPA